MNNQRKIFVYRCLLILSALIILQPGNAGAVINNACSSGNGIPPFLSSGIDPNLLLVIDNSGSMLDAAYDETSDTQRCFDDSYATDHPYAGYFDNTKWYTWDKGSYNPWANGVQYAKGDRVYAYGVIWEATSEGTNTSNGSRVDDDTGVDWQHVLQVSKWANNTPYPAKSMVWSGQQLYITDLGGTSNDAVSTDGLNLADDTGVIWREIDSTWRNDKTYASGNIVTYNGFYYQAKAGGVTATPDNKIYWSRLNEGSFAEIDQASALTACVNAAGSDRKHNDLCISINEAVTPKHVTAFVAKGNFLNWAMASKFDIEKKILTGGKHNFAEELMLSEHRGCSGSRMIKQIEFNDGYHLTMGVRGSKYNDDPAMEDRIDSTDDVGRLEILAITQNGFQGSAACTNALNEIAENGLNGTQSLIKACTDTFPTTSSELADQNPVLNHSLQFCWQLENHQRNLGNVISECENLYKGIHVSQSYLPSELVPAYGAYICYGNFDNNLDHVNRNGYVGRCWDPGGSSTVKSCNPLPEVSAASGGCDLEGCEYGAEPNKYKNEVNYNYKCTSFTNSGACKTHVSDLPGNRKYWQKQFAWSDGSGTCTEGQIAPGTSPAGWEEVWASHPSFDDPANCILQASIDYCNDMKVPEVIDPSDAAGDTTNYWNIPGLLKDSEVVAQLGATHPLSVMKGYIRQSARPEGILQAKEVKEIRMGAMAFNSVGAKTECAPEYLTSGIEKYCPKNNKDGAKLVSIINKGSVVTNENDTSYVSGKRRHVDELAESINSIRATSWTPLAEAMFNALGYFTQNDAFCLNKDSSGQCLDFPINSGNDPIQYSCQDNNIIVITEGESTADINQKVAEFIASPSPYFGNTPTTSDNVAGDGDVDLSATCSNLAGSTYFDDMTWWGQHLGPLFAVRQLDGSDKQSVITQVVATSALTTKNSSTPECNPTTLMENAAINGGRTLLTGENPEQLETNLRSALADILFRTSAGSAASVISSSRSGEGGVYQAIFWPKIARGIGKDPLLWAGDVHAFFIDEHGLLWDDFSGNDTATIGELWSEDTNANGLLETGEDGNGNGVLDGDRRIVTFYNNTSNSTQICFNPSVITSGVCQASQYWNTPSGSLELRDFDRYLWSAKVQLGTISDAEISTNRGVLADGTWDFSTNRRYIFTWNDLDNDGIVDTDFDSNGLVDNDGDGKDDQEEVLQFQPGLNNPVLNVGAVTSRNPLLSDFKVATNAELDHLINWVRGLDIYESDTSNPGVLDASEDINQNGVRDYAYRCRKYPNCDPTATNSPSWRLGDVIHSTPTLVTRPAEGYHLIYKDPTYAEFYKKYVERRHVIYFGSNDGMLHAANGGFYQPGINKFLPCREDQRNSETNQCIATQPYNMAADRAYPALGDELWAYVPYNLQTHLSCLMAENYNHKYFIDAPPRVFDVRIFPDDSIHPKGWGTILVGYMRFGGAPVVAGGTDNREFVSSYFVLDITDPERPPKLLGEMTMTNEKNDYNGDGVLEDKYTRLGYTTAMPSIVAMRNDSGNSEWYLVLGNGPTTLKGTNDQQGKVAIIPLNSLAGVNWTVNASGAYDSTDRKAFRIPNEEPTQYSTAPLFGRKLIESDSSGKNVSFVGDMVTIDYNLSNSGTTGVGVAYKTDAVYFGTVDGEDFDATQKYWNGDGRLFRLVTNEVDAGGKQLYSYPESWYLKKLIDAHGPITAAPNIGSDGDNFWVYFGTGRFFAPEDKTDTFPLYFFGIKEPFTSGCKISWGEVEWWPATATSPIATDPSAAPGKQGLFRSDLARVVEKDLNNPTLFNDNYFYCDGCSYPQFTAINDPLAVDATHTYYAFSELEKYIQGEKCGTTSNTAIGVDGWYRVFTDLRERSLGMPTLLGGLVTYTSYQPFADLCLAEGQSNLFGVYYLTGTAWHENVFGTSTIDNKQIVNDRLNLGKGLATTPSLQSGGGPNDVNAYIQTSTGEIVTIGQNNLPLSNFKSGRSNWRTR